MREGGGFAGARPRVLPYVPWQPAGVQNGPRLGQQMVRWAPCQGRLTVFVTGIDRKPTGSGIVAG